VSATPQTVDLDAALERAAEILGGAAKVALACHVNPDADAAGSMLALAAILHARGVEVVCSWGNPPPLERPSWFALFDGADRWIVEPNDFPATPEVMVTLDAASADRLGLLEPNMAAARECIVIDHHRTNPGFGTLMLLDGDASSTAEMVFRLHERMGGQLPDGAAACLYAGLVTDTGRFQYEATTPETLRVAAELRRHPFDQARMAQVLFEETPFAALRVTGLALDRAELDPEASLVWTYVTQADLARFGADMTDTEDLIDAVRTAREADVAAVMKQQPDGRFKVSMRSKGATNVGAIAQSWGGGGHRLAAGYTSSWGPTETARLIREALTGGSNGAGAMDA
jgi:phosphoesterase RecJ-like protein